MPEDSAVDNPKKKQKRFLRYFVALTILLLITGGTFVVLKILSGPAEGVVTVSTIPDDTPHALARKQFVSKYFTASYPGRYDIQSSSKYSASLEAWLLVAHQVLGEGPAGIISVTVSRLPTGGVKEDSAYKQYEAFKNLYTLSTRAYMGEEVVIADRTEDNFEHTALWPHSNFFLSVSMTSNSKNEVLLNEFETILSGLEWNP